MNITVAGAGYVGMATAICFANCGYNVKVYDPDRSKIKSLNEKKVPFFEKGIEQLLKKNEQRLQYFDEPKAAFERAEIVFVAVGTPEGENGEANLSYVYQCVKEVSSLLKNDCIIVVKSTVPIGTNALIERFANENVSGNYKIDVVSNPEFLSQGSLVHDIFNPTRIVIGAQNEQAQEKIAKLYHKIDAPVLKTNTQSAEMIKYASNDFLALKISYINEIATLCELTGADVEHVSKGMGLDPRIGDKFLKAGLGFGGSCFPKDTKALCQIAKQHNYNLQTVSAVIDVNNRQKIKPYQIAKQYYKDLAGINVAMIGVSFKPGTDDFKEGPCEKCVPLFLKEGATIRIWDKVCAKKFAKSFEQVFCFETIEETIENADLCIIFTPWEDVLNFELSNFETLMKKPIIIDGRNCFELHQAKKQKITYISIGREVVKNSK